MALTISWFGFIEFETSNRDNVGAVLCPFWVTLLEWIMEIVASVGWICILVHERKPL